MLKDLKSVKVPDVYEEYSNVIDGFMHYLILVIDHCYGIHPWYSLT